MLLIAKNIIDAFEACWRGMLPSTAFPYLFRTCRRFGEGDHWYRRQLFTGGQHRFSYAAGECKFRGLPPALAWHILMYMPQILEATMQRTAKIFMNNRSQAVRLPKEFQFTTSEVFIRRQGNDVILSTRPTDWSAYLASGPVASKEFMEGVEDLAVQ